jgi:hypothetical protein
MMHCHNIGVFEGHTHLQNPPKLHRLAQGVVTHPFDALAQGARPHVGLQAAVSASSRHGWLLLGWLLLAIGG